tara:strand:+ start:3910 stop:4767 length:858 start_codon:yes stop_codon:yes gene_type:complete
MSDMIALKATLPKHIKSFSGSNPFAAASKFEGLKTLTTKGGVFNIEYGDYRDLLSETTLDVVIMSANLNKSKTYYDEGFEEGSIAKLTCYSNDGTAPSENSEAPQAKKCAICPHNQWGSRITDRGGKGKACSDSMRLCVATTDSIDDIMLLKVTATALKALGHYGAQLVKRGVDPKYVVTQLGFNPDLEFPSLVFKAVRFIEEDELKIVDQVIEAESEAMGKITGVIDSPIDTVGGFPIIPKEVKAEPKPEVKAEPKPKEPEVKANKVEDYDDIDEALENLDFDD